MNPYRNLSVPEQVASHLRRVIEEGRLEGAMHGVLRLEDELAACGVQPGSYHLPDWDETAEGLLACLESLFRATQPTAVIADGIALWLATQQFLASRRIRVPQDLSLVCTDGSPDFVAWCRPVIAHIRWDSRPVVSRIVRWANDLAKGRQDQRHVFTPAEFVRGGTIGPVNARGQ